jgi:delta 1-pyrroline-5-carboxylate dehydrogenase
MGFLEPHGRSCRLFRRARLTGPAVPCRGTEAEARAEGLTGPAIVVHSLAHAVGALRAAARVGRPIILLSAPEAGVYAGPGWFGALVEAAREAVPDARFSAILDCGDQAGAALAAIRAQIERVIFTGRADVASRLADIARQHGVRLETTRPAAVLDLGADFFASAESVEQRCADILVDQARN